MYIAFLDSQPHELCGSEVTPPPKKKLSSFGSRGDHLPQCSITGDANQGIFKENLTGGANSVLRIGNRQCRQVGESNFLTASHQHMKGHRYFIQSKLYV